MKALPAGLVAMLLDPGQGCKQQVPRGQQHAVVEEQQQLLQGMEEMLQGLRELDLRCEHAERVSSDVRAMARPEHFAHAELFPSRSSIPGRMDALLTPRLQLTL